MTATTTRLTRRSFVRGSLLTGALALGATGCGGSSNGSEASDGTTPPVRSPRPTGTATARPGGPRVLLAYYSRPGENYRYGGRVDLEVGNTEVLAGLVAERVACDVHRIEAADPYPDDYDATVRRNTEEQDADARPRLAGTSPEASAYDVVLLASPIWNVRPPMLMQTFAEGLDLAGTRVHPLTTHAMSGLGDSERDYRSACRGATLGEGLAVQGETVTEAGPEVAAWLERVGLA